jgi:AraC-like DNA-binding protein
MRESSVATSLVADVIGYLERQGLSAETVCRAAGIDPDLLAQPDARMPGSLMERLWAEGERLTGDPDLGLHTAEAYNPGALDIVGYVVLSCRTAADALDRLGRYAAVLNEGLQVEISREGDRTVCRFEVVETLDNYLVRHPRQAMEAMAAGIAVTTRRLTETDIEPLEITFRHEAPPSIREHLRLLGPLVQFSQPENRIAFHTADLSATVRSSNPALLAVFDQHAEALLHRLLQHGPVSRSVLKSLGGRLKGVVPTLRQVAQEIAISDRSLQRALRDEGTSFQRLLDEARHELAIGHLSVPGTSAAEVAFLLGFSEPSAFSRAFLRWTGMTPGAYRDR